MPWLFVNLPIIQMRKVLSTLLSILVIVLSACNSASPTPLPAATREQAPAPTAHPSILPPASQPTPQPATPVPPASPTPLVQTIRYPLPAYTLQAALDYPVGQMVIRQHLGFTNLTGEPLSDLRFYAETNRYPDTLTLDSLLVNGKEFDNFLLNRNVLILSFPGQSIEPLQSLEIDFIYTIQLPEMHSRAGNGLFGKSQWQINLFDWYFWLAAYSPEEGWLIHPPAGFAEHTTYPLANFQLLLTVQDPPENLMVTGSSDALVAGNTYQFAHPAARSLVVSMSPNFEMVECSQAGVTVHHYFFPIHKQTAEWVLQSTCQAVEIYSKIISPYRHPVLNIIETNLIDGLEGDGMYFLGSAFYTLGTEPRSLLTILAIHETAHQWWYAGVANDQALEPWLDESFATFMEGIYYENTSGDDFNWWKGYRLAGNPAKEVVNSPLYDFRIFRPYRNAVYLRGASFLMDLKKEMGEEKFQSFLQQYYQRASTPQLSSSELFFSVLSEYDVPEAAKLLDKYFLLIEDEN